MRSDEHVGDGDSAGIALSITFGALGGFVGPTVTDALTFRRAKTLKPGPA